MSMNRILVTGSSGHLGEALVTRLRNDGHDVVGLDILPGPTTTTVGSICDPAVVGRVMAGVDAVVHTATLHKPHVATHTREQFVATNLTGTVRVLEAAAAAGVERFVFTSTTSAFGRALTVASGAPAAWISEEVVPIPKNIYGVTKVAAEDLCELVHRDTGLPCLVLRTSRFFPEDDDDPGARDRYGDQNLKANEFLYRRVEIGDAVDAHLLALARAPELGFDKFIISATTPFSREHTAALGTDAAAVVAGLFPEVVSLYADRGFTLPASLDRVYDNARARRVLGWRPRFDFRHVLDRLAAGHDVLGPLAATIGRKGYHRPAP
ncbi:NAD-dependent epimerase/dehydratase family protein [Haliangium sp.]|uniref:NAD-dependent epimerase/dehydratase family protein n=1 Tax=Haliangium sp. TaxID=2663208 RepID=UPI003D11A5AC